MCRECWERFYGNRGLAIPACITVRAWQLSDKNSVGFLWDSGHARAVMPAGIANQRFPLKSVVEKTFPAFPTHAQPAIVRILQEGHCLPATRRPAQHKIVLTISKAEVNTLGVIAVWDELGGFYTHALSAIHRYVALISKMVPIASDR